MRSLLPSKRVSQSKVSKAHRRKTHHMEEDRRKLWTTLWHWARSLDLRQAILTTRLAGSNMARAKKWQRFLDIWMLFRLERDGNTRRWHARFMTDRCTAAEFWMTRDR